MLSAPLVVTFVLYLCFLLGVGIYFFKRATRLEGYLLGDRGVGPWVTALSAQASDMSGWLLMGLPGAVWLSGVTESWIAVGLFVGTALNWIFVSSRLRVYTQKLNAITLPSFFEARFRDPTGLLRTLSALIVLFFFTIYVSSGLVAAGKLFEAILEIPYWKAVLGGGVIIVLYTFLGGYLAVCWTDLFQGALMFFAITLVPAVALFHVGGFDAVGAAMAAREMTWSLIPDKGGAGWALLAVVSTMAWGLGYFGQPHILTRFMSVKSVGDLPKSRVIALVWVFISLCGAVCAGLVGIALFEEVPGGDPEKVFIHTIGTLFPPLVGGVLLAAVLSAIMSTIDSQLLVSSSALAEDFFKRGVGKGADDRTVMRLGRESVILVSVIALCLAINPDNSVLDLVAYAWGGFGAAFGPVILFALFSKRTTWRSALAGMAVGTTVLVVWKFVGVGEEKNLSDYMYEIVPGFIANALTIWAVNLVSPQKDEEIIGEFEAAAREVMSG